LTHTRNGRFVVRIFLALLVFGMFFGACSLISSTKKAKAADNTYYVRTDGNDGLDGLSDANAWATLSKVRTALSGGIIVAGDTISFRRGDTFAGYIRVNKSGDVDSPITFDAYGTGANPIIDATGIANSFDFRVVAGTGASNITVSNIDLKNGTAVGFLMLGGGSNITISNCNVSANVMGAKIATGTFSNITISGCNFGGMSYGFYIFTVTAISGVTISDCVFANNSAANISVVPVAQISGLSITDCTCDGSTAGYGIAITNGTDITISETTTSNNVRQGLYLRDLSNLTITNHTSSSNTLEGISINSATASSDISITDSVLDSNGLVSKANGFSSGNAGSDITVTRVTASNNGGDGFGISGSLSNVVFDDCLADTNGVDGLGADGDGFSYHDTTTGTIKNSISRNNKKSSIAQVNTSNVSMYNNLFYHATNGTTGLVTLSGGTYNLYHNTVYSAGHTGVGVILTSSATVNMKNNIVMNFDTGVSQNVATVTEDYNLVYGATTANYTGLTPGAHSIQLDPKLTNPPTDFPLQSTSPAIDAGISTGMPTTDYIGASRYDDPNIVNSGGGTSPYYDIGAYEVTSAICPAPTVNATSDTSLTVVITSSNTDPVEFAIYNSTASKYIQANGTLGASAIWQTKAAWGGASGIANTGLTPSTSYTYKVKERGVDGVETALSSGTTQSTQATPTPTPTPTPALTTTSADQISTTTESSTPTAPLWQRLLSRVMGTTASSPVSFTTVPIDLSAIEIEQGVVFDASSLGSNIASYVWNFGDGGTSSDKKVEHKYETPGRYTVTLTTTDKSGKVSIMNRTIDIRPPAPTISDIKADGTSIIITGKSFPTTTVNLLIHSNIYSGQTVTDKDGQFSYTLDNASETLGEGDHTVLATAAVIFSDKTQLKGKDSKTYDFKVSVDSGKLKVEMKKTKTWQIVSIILSGIIIVGLGVVVALRKRRKGRGAQR